MNSFMNIVISRFINFLCITDVSVVFPIIAAKFVIYRNNIVSFRLNVYFCHRLRYCMKSKLNK